jgi:hypothetical protein
MDKISITNPFLFSLELIEKAIGFGGMKTLYDAPLRYN